jgi:TPR repeat protein
MKSLQIKLITLLLSSIFTSTIANTANAGNPEAIAAYKAGDFATAYKEFSRQAKRGDAFAQSNLGLMYSNGQGVAQNYELAMSWFDKAAEQGDTSAQYCIGVMHHKGQGVTQDFAQAISWYNKAAELGHAQAQTNIGTLHYTGQGVPKDEAKAATWFAKAAEQKHESALYNLGVMYKEGRGVSQNAVVALALFELIATDPASNGAKAKAVTAERLSAKQIETAKQLALELLKPGNFSKAIVTALKEST